MCLYNSFTVYAYTGKLRGWKLEGYDKSIDPESRPHIIMFSLMISEKLEPAFHPVKYFGRDRVLMQRKLPGPKSFQDFGSDSDLLACFQFAGIRDVVQFHDLSLGYTGVFFHDFPQCITLFHCIQNIFPGGGKVAGF